MTATDSKRAFTTAEAADYIGQSVSSLRALKYARVIPARKTQGTTGKLIFLREELDAYLDGLAEA